MIKWLTHSSLKLRKSEEFCKPLGPSFSSASPRKLNFSGASVTFMAPRGSRPSSAYDRTPALKGDVLRYPLSRHNNGVMANEEWVQLGAYGDFFCFNGPWFRGYEAFLHMYIQVLARKTQESSTSLFHPKALEYNISNYLDARYGHELYHQKALWIAPFNWRVMNIPPIQAAHFFVQPSSLGTSSPYQLLMFPVTDNHLLKVSIFHQYNRKKVDATDIIELANKIMASFRIEFSPEMSEHLERIKVEANGAALGDHFPPLQWPPSKTSDKPEKQKLENH